MKLNTLLVSCCLGALLGAPAVGGTPAFAAGTSPTQTIEAMLKTNHSLRSLKENREAVGHEIDHAKAGYGPRVDGTIRGGYGILSDSTTRQYDYDHWGPYANGSLILTQPVWDGLLTKSRVDEAKATYRSMDARVLDNATTLALDAIIAHIDVLRRREICRMSMENVAYHEDILARTRERQSRGIDSMADVNQAEGRLTRSRATLSQAQAYLQIGEDTYKRLTRMPAGELEPVPVPAVMYKGIEDIMAEAEKHNPKLTAFMEDVTAAQARKDQARAAYHPTIDIEAGPSFTERDGRDRLRTSEFSVSGVMRWNLFNSGADVASNKAAAARVRQARQDVYDFMDELKLNVEQSWSEYITAREQMDFYRKAMEYNRDTRVAYEEQFMMGHRTLLDVLHSEDEYFNSSTQAVTARSNVLIAIYNMKALAGTLLAEFKIDPETLKKAPEQNPDDEPLWPSR
ncbi:MAG: TolC family outer membrane protein [Desulfovibrionaceae bacterium]|nr:TolC family outer membrane protein [Desulfovibrionaceae bacterium]